MSTVLLTTGKLQVVESLGNPVKETTESGMTILWYGYKAPELADFYYFKDENLVLISKGYYQTPKSFREYLSAYGNPDVSVRKYTGEDSLQETVHIWASKGHAVTTVGSDKNSSVIREDMYTPVTLQEYFATWGVNIVQNQKVTITNQLREQLTSQPLVLVVTSVGAVGMLTLLIFCVIWLRMKRSSRGSSTNQTPGI